MRAITCDLSGWTVTRRAAMQHPDGRRVDVALAHVAGHEDSDQEHCLVITDTGLELPPTPAGLTPATTYQAAIDRAPTTVEIEVMTA